MSVSVKIGWVPGHSGIMYNDMADSAAKEGSRRTTTIVNPQLNFSEAVKMATAITRDRWQNAWERSQSGEATRDLLPQVGTKMIFPEDRSTGISIIRSTLNSANVNESLYQMRFVVSPNCNCGEGRESVEHVLTQCPMYELQREVLVNGIKDLWMNLNRKGGLNLSMKLILCPSSFLDMKTAKL